jgi:hypothetical protein
MSRSPAEDCLLCRAERVTTWYFESAECWVADCLVCATPMVVWRTHGLPTPATERELLDLLSRTAAERFGPEGFWIDPDRRRIPDHWHAHARPRGGFFGPDSTLYGKEWSRAATEEASEASPPRSS